MNFKKVLISELIPDAGNPRKDLKPEDPEYKQIKTSIESFGDLEPIVFNTRTKKIVGGHQRLKVFKEQGLADLFVVEAGAYSWAFAEDDLKELTPEKEKAANIALNKIGGDWNFPQLSIWLSELKEADFDISITGFSDEELKKIDEDLFGKRVTLDTEPQISRAEELRKEWGTELGQMWQCGEHRVICGDCTDLTIVKRVMGDEKADMVFTDPPYGMDKKFKNDSHKDMRPFHHSWISVIKDYAPAFLIWYDPKHMSDIIVVAEDYLGRMTDYFHMYKPNDIAYPLHSWIRISESMIVFGKPDYQDIKPFSHDTYLWNHTKKDKSFYHPSVKPMEIVADLIPRLGGETYLDPFLGSGTTMIACENLGRKCRGCEIDPGYVAVILQRYKDTFNKQPVLIE